jgi:hypothetical protein
MDLTAEKPASGISRLGIDMYRINCRCTDDAHDITLCVEADTQSRPLYELYFSMHSIPYKEYLKIDYAASWHIVCFKNTVNTVLNRIRACASILFKGHIKMDTGVILDEQAAKNLAAILDNTKS